MVDDRIAIRVRYPQHKPTQAEKRKAADAEATELKRALRELEAEAPTT